MMFPLKKETSTQDHHRFREMGCTQNASCMFLKVFDGGLEHVSFHVEGILKTMPIKKKKKRHLGDVQQPILPLRDGSKTCSLQFDMVPSSKAAKILSDHFFFAGHL